MADIAAQKAVGRAYVAARTALRRSTYGSMQTLRRTPTKLTMIHRKEMRARKGRCKVGLDCHLVRVGSVRSYWAR